MNPTVFETCLYHVIFPNDLPNLPVVSHKKILSIFPAEDYSGIFVAIEKASKKTDAVTFHAKNIANTLESRSSSTFLVQGIWDVLGGYIYIYIYIYT